MLGCFGRASRAAVLRLALVRGLAQLEHQFGKAKSKRRSGGGAMFRCTGKAGRSIPASRRSSGLDRGTFEVDRANGLDRRHSERRILVGNILAATFHFLAPLNASQ